ncbi:MAG TPA: aromatic ring-hydroxylating dioxygenase subunit alpha [Burkholderiales bacterium]|nr:aromatic ring-hydroxylating dioxygenase subunit alpha [Burkholderiales bacterium]
MTNLANLSALARTPVQLPVSWYFDPGIAEIEQRTLFAQAPGYVGHELMVPNAGDYHVLDWLDNGRVLVHGDAGIRLLSNVCRHRQSILLKGRGNAHNIVCPVHRWTYDLQGKLLGAPDFPDNPCLDLSGTGLKTWNGLLFAGPRDPQKDLSSFGLAPDYDFTGYVLDRVEVTEYSYNWKAFMEVYLELYHVGPFHPGLAKFVDPAAYRWSFGERWSSQELGVYQNLTKAGSPAYGRYIEALLRYQRGEIPKYGTVWSCYYPNIMLEWYPSSLVISTVHPRGPEKCINVVEYYYPEEVALFERELVRLHQEAYAESAGEDGEICQLMHDGRRVLYRDGTEAHGPYQSPSEDGMVHFHEFVRRHIAPELETVR